MKQKVFIQLLTRIFFVVFIVTLLTGVLFYSLTLRRVSEANFRHTTEVLDQSRKLVDTILEQIELTAYTIAINSDVLACLSRKWRIEDDYQVLIRVNDLFIDEIHSSSFLHSISLYSSMNNKVLSDSGIIELGLHRDRGLINRYHTLQSTSVWLNTRENPDQFEPSHVISFLMKMPASSQNVRGALVLNVVEDFLSNTVVDLKSADLGDIYIVDRRGTVLSNVHKERLYTRLEYLPESLEELSGQGYFLRRSRGGKEFVSYTTSDYNDWIYMAVTPYSAIMGPSRLILFLSLAVSGISLVIGLVLSIYVSKMYYRPIKQIMSLLSDYKRVASDDLPI
jgi:two-component system sensor histidine kinase YesM